MMETLRIITGESLVDILEKSRNDWVLCWPGQVVIAGSQTYWTASVEKGIANNNLYNYYEQHLGEV